MRRLHRVLHGDTSEMPYLVLDVPALLESGLFREVNRLLWMDIDNIVQFDRLKARDGISEAGARRIRRSQPGIALGRALANDVIDNSGSRETLQAQVHELHHLYSRLAANHSQ